jgi:hypothetical protein
VSRLATVSLALLLAAAPVPPAFAATPLIGKGAPSPCRSGSFRTENSSISFEAFFTNLASAPCIGVDGYCLFHLFVGGPGDYRESDTVHFAGTRATGGTPRCGSR